MATSSLMFIGINGSVLALDKSNGREVWRAKLTGSDFVNVVIEDGSIYATTKGEIFCLSTTSGEIRWHNPLKGLGWGLVSIGLPGAQNAVLAEKWHRDRAARESYRTDAV